ncbi:MAG: hypothetical protein JW839_11085 [Candidatus Lokiarchaeota archaeon]|nr:hypothetical protein [Candidatus Lokiarchaeota archaeon]
MIGTWVAASGAIKALVLRPDGSCQVDGAPARWRAMGDEVWLLDDEARAGTRWRYSCQGDGTLALTSPEDFKYLGGNEYIYFQMTPPSAVVILTRAGRAGS